MKYFRLVLFTLLVTSLFFAPSAQAFPDQYSGDTSIYEGVAQDVGRPNIMFIIDNSQATLTSVSVADDVTFRQPRLVRGSAHRAIDCTGDQQPGQGMLAPLEHLQAGQPGRFCHPGDGEYGLYFVDPEL